MFAAFHIGQTQGLRVPISRDDLLRYVELSGDSTPLHVDSGFAKAAGFEGAATRLHSLDLGQYQLQFQSSFTQSWHSHERI
jgi:acyl dehydratase